jgi:hypothetical protein
MARPPLSRPGKAPPDIDTKRLTQADAVPIAWSEQRQKLGLSSRH